VAGRQSQCKESLITLKPVLDLGPNSWDSTCQFWPLTPICKIKRHGKGQRKEIYYMVGDMLWQKAE
jgi:hypothetical protein